tara:strand:+ start:507 stop:1406 length:900 start_codon:yes stop_codon:yes gene_type:complete
MQNNKNDIENLYLDSGGIYGFTICGSLQCLQEKGILKNIKNILGCSVGGILGLFLALGYSSEEIFNISYYLDLKKIINIKKNNFLNIYKNYGFDDGKKLENIFKILIKNKTNNENLTFKELYDYNKKTLIIIGNNINKRRYEIFNKDNSPNMELWKAVRITCSLPLIFKPYKYNNFYYVDGGNSCNNTNYFKNKNKTIGIMLERGEIGNFKIESFEEYLTNLFYSPLKSLKFYNYIKDNCIEIDTHSQSISFVNFSISNKNKISLYEFGYNQTQEQIKEILKNINSNKSSFRNIGTQTD